MTQRKATLSNREAAALYGEGWECSESGTDVFHRLKVDVAASPAPALLPSEQLALNRAQRLLKRHRLAGQIIVEQLQVRAASLAAIPFSKLIAGKSVNEVRAQVADQRKRLDEMPTEPKIHRLDPDADTQLPADAKKAGTSIWYLDKASMVLTSREVTRVTLERINDVPTLVYETAGTLPDGTVVRRSCAHHLDGLKVLNHAELAFIDPMAARDYLNRHMAASKPAVPAVAEPIPPPPPKVQAAPKANGTTRAAPAHVPEPISEHEIDHEHALRPFDESMLKGH